MGSPELARVAEQHLRELCRKFPMKYTPVLEWRSFRVTAGMAYYRAGIIGLSLTVLKDPESVRETLGHEYAHLLAVDRVGNRGAGHGVAWKLAMKDLGLEPKIRHNYEVERNDRRQQVDYLCVKCGATIIRKRRLPRQRKYVHATCGGELKLLRIFKVIQATPAP